VRQTVRVRLKRCPGAQNLPIPAYMSEGASGMDLHACVDEPVVIPPGERRLIPTGFSISLPSGYEAQIRPRSGLALNNGITILNSPGTIDSDYRGEISVILANLGQAPFTVRRADRIAQMVIARVARAELEVAESIDKTEREDGGFGHTGIGGKEPAKP